MKNRKSKIVLVVSTFILLLTLPLAISLIFSTSNQDGIAVNKKIEADYINSNKKIILLFFGYVGCQDICTPVLENLNNLYESKEFSKLKGEVEIMFVNLTPEIENFQADLFAKYFNKNFKGIYLTREEILRIDRNFALYFSRALGNNSELNHTDYIYLIKNDNNLKTIKKLLPVHPIQNEKIIKSIMEAL